MRKFLLIFFMAAGLCGAAAAFAVGENSDARIKSVDFQEQGANEVVQVSLSGAVVPNVFEIGGENPRVVCDFPGTAYPARLQRVINVQGEMIKRLRVGIHNEPVAKTRIVVDLQGGVKYDISKDFRAEDNSLVIKVTRQDRQIAVEEQAVEKEPVPAEEPAAEEKPAPVEEPASEKEPPTEIEKDEVAPPAPQTKTPQPDVATQDEAVERVEEKAEEEAKEKVKPEPMAPKPDAVEPGREEMSLPQEEMVPPPLQGPETEADKVNPVLLDIRYESAMHDKEMVLFRLNGFHPPVIFSTEDEQLLVVCEFLDATLGKKVDPLMETDGKYIRRVSAAMHQEPDKVRVVLELAGEYNYDLKQVFFKEDNLFVVVISNLGEKEQ